MKAKVAITIAVITLVLLLIGLGVAIVFVRNQQETRSKASGGTVNLKWEPPAINLVKGETKVVKLKAAAPSVSIGGVQIQLQMEPPEAIELITIEKVESATFPNVLQALEVSGKTVRFSLGTSLATATGTDVEVATITIKALKDGAVTFSDDGSKVSAVDQKDVSVLATNGLPAITIAVGAISGTPAPTTSITPAITPTGVAPSPTTGAAITASPTPLPVGPPTCTNLVAQPTSGSTPLTVNLTGTGTIASPGLVTAVEFSFGEGPTQVIEKTYGTSAQATVTHTYNSPGSFQVFVRFKDASGNWSSIPTSCTNLITVTQGAGNAGTSHFSCRGGACLAVAGSGRDECKPNENQCQQVGKSGKMPRTGSSLPLVAVTAAGLLLLALGMLL